MYPAKIKCHIFLLTLKVGVIAAMRSKYESPGESPSFWLGCPLPLFVLSPCPSFSLSCVHVARALAIILWL